MKDYILKDEWNIIENKFVPENNRVSESIFSIGNGHMGQRANFEESYSGDTMQGSYLAGSIIQTKPVLVGGKTVTQNISLKL